MSTSLDFKKMYQKELNRAREEKANLEKHETIKIEYANVEGRRFNWTSPNSGLRPNESFPVGLYYHQNVFALPTLSLINNELESSCKRGKDWTQLENRQLLNVGGIPHANGLLVDRNVPFWLRSLMDSLYQEDDARAISYKPNHALINRYSLGSGIALHKDGEYYESRAIVISTCGSSILKFYRDKEKTSLVCGVILQPNSLVLFEGFYYTELFHGIEQVKPQSNAAILLFEEANIDEIWNWDMIKEEGKGGGQGSQSHEMIRAVGGGDKIRVDRTAVRISITLRKAKNEREGEETLEGEKEKFRLSSWWKNAVNDV